MFKMPKMPKMPKLKIDTNSKLLLIIIIIVMFIGLYVIYYNDNEEVVSKLEEVLSIEPPSCPNLECPACPEPPEPPEPPEIITPNCPACPQQIPCAPPNIFMDIGNSIKGKCLNKCLKGDIKNDKVKKVKCDIECKFELDKLAERVHNFVNGVDDYKEVSTQKTRLPTREEEYEMKTPKEKVKIKEVIKYKEGKCPPPRNCKECRECKECKPNIPCPKCRKCPKCKRQLSQKCKKFPSANEIMGGVFPGRLKKIEGGRHFPITSFNESCPIRTEASIYETPGGFNNASVISITNDYFNSTVPSDNEELKRNKIVGRKIKQQKADPMEVLKKRQRDPLKEFEKKVKLNSIGQVEAEPKKLTKKKTKKKDIKEKKKKMGTKIKEKKQKKMEKKKIEEEKKKIEEEKKKIEEEKKKMEEDSKAGDLINRDV